jgi:hypothetical protein
MTSNMANGHQALPSVSEVRLLLICQIQKVSVRLFTLADQSKFLVPALVLPNEPQHQGYLHQNHSYERRNHALESRRVSWCLLGDEQLRCYKISCGVRQEEAGRNSNFARHTGEIGRDHRHNQDVGNCVSRNYVDARKARELVRCGLIVDEETSDQTRDIRKYHGDTAETLDICS